MTHILRVAETKDAKALSEICIATFREAYSQQNKKEDVDYYVNTHFTPRVVADELKNKDTTFIVSEKESNLTGYVKLVKKSGKTEIARIYVRKEFYGQGLAHQLLEKSKEVAITNGHSTLVLAVWQQNHRAVAFYKKTGFFISGTTTFDWGTGKIDEDYRMELNF